MFRIICLFVSFYLGAASIQNLGWESGVKMEAVHELGHAFGLGHCPDPYCVMHFSNSLMDTDRKNAFFCARCMERLKNKF